MKKWLKEIARDLLALGSIPFYFLVVIRLVIGDYRIILYRIIIAFIVISLLYFVIKDSDLYVARSLALLVFTSMFYNEIIFTFFTGIVWVLLLFAAYYVKRKIGAMFRGIIIGAISSLVGYYGGLYI